MMSDGKKVGYFFAIRNKMLNFVFLSKDNG